MQAWHASVDKPHPDGARAADLRGQQVQELDVVDEGGDEREARRVEVLSDLDVCCALLQRGDQLLDGLDDRHHRRLRGLE